MSRGLRNCNPGNIRCSATRYLGEVRPSRDASFKQFATMAYGYRAMFVLLDTYARRYGLHSIRTMIERYAPPSENDTRRYSETVSRLSGIEADRHLDTRSHDEMVAVVAAMSRVENGVAAVVEQVEQGWQLYAADRDAGKQRQQR
ncbi:MAG: structural protein P5 [Alistipes sp.]|nr:structural protein P5 [Alistipes sp.]MDE6861307.1 structural protein P5 [Alistipes sp.]MDE7129116.1 structural protein P5 [Alistipes sp.]